jgi:hypothetical protein
VRTEIRKAVVQKQTTLTKRAVPSFGQVTKAEKGLIWLLIHEPHIALAALSTLESQDIEPLVSASVLDLARKLDEDKGFSPSAYLERLNTVEAQLVTGIASEREPHVKDADGCVRIIRRLRLERESAALQREIDRLQQLGTAEHGKQMDALSMQKRDVRRRLEDLI